MSLEFSFDNNFWFIGFVGLDWLGLDYLNYKVPQTEKLMPGQVVKKQQYVDPGSSKGHCVEQTQSWFLSHESVRRRVEEGEWLILGQIEKIRVVLGQNWSWLLSGESDHDWEQSALG